MDFYPVEKAFKEAVVQEIFPGAVVLVSKDDQILYERSFGYRSLIPEKTPLQPGTIFDLASLTKPLATSIAMMFLVREKKVRLDDRVTRFLPTFGVFSKHQTTCRHLLNHSSGLAAWKPYFEDIIKSEKGGRINFVASRAAKDQVLEQVHREKPLGAPGTQSLYSDLGFMVLGEIIEALSASTLDRFCHDKIFRPLGLRSTAFIDITQVKAHRMQPVVEMIAPTENCPWRKKIMCGEVHDDNAYVMGGVAGHAGLFSSARDIHILLTRLHRCYRGEDDFLPQSVVREFLTKDESVDNSTFALGWDTPSSHKSASGSLFSPRSVGHLGFTGASFWCDIEKNCQIILLTNRIHPSRKNEKIRDFRPYIHDLIMRVFSS